MELLCVSPVSVSECENKNSFLIRLMDALAFEGCLLKVNPAADPPRRDAPDYLLYRYIYI